MTEGSGPPPAAEGGKCRMHTDDSDTPDAVLADAERAMGQLVAGTMEEVVSAVVQRNFLRAARASASLQPAPASADVTATAGLPIPRRAPRTTSTPRTPFTV